MKSDEARSKLESEKEKTLSGQDVHGNHLHVSPLEVSVQRVHTSVFHGDFMAIETAGLDSVDLTPLLGI
jgi:hypothetical protein